jgi:hypothetical protein
MSRQKSGKSSHSNTNIVIILVLVLVVVTMSILPLFQSHTSSNEAYGCGCSGGAYPLPNPEPTKASDEGYQLEGKKGGECKRVIAIPSVDSIPQLVHAPITVPWRRLCRKCE